MKIARIIGALFSLHIATVAVADFENMASVELEMAVNAQDITVEDKGHQVIIRINGMVFIPSGIPIEDAITPTHLKVTSAMLNLRLAEEKKYGYPFIIVPIKGYSATITLRNYAKSRNVPIVDYIRAVGTTSDGKLSLKRLVFNPNNPFVFNSITEPFYVAGNRNFRVLIGKNLFRTKEGELAVLGETSIGIVMHPTRPTVGLKSLVKERIAAGPQPSLEDLYK